MKVFYSVIAAAFLLLGALPVHGQQGAKPLLMPGKSTLFQRILTRPGAALRPTADLGTPGESVKPFSLFYVYEHRKSGGKDWVRVGYHSDGTSQGWLTAQETTPWKQTLTVVFKEPLEHDRVVLFKDRDSLRELVNKNDRIGFRRLYREAVGGTLSADSPVVAVQPKAHVDIHEDFYLVPIMQYEEVYLGSAVGLMLQVSTVPLVEEEKKREQAAQAAPPAAPPAGSEAQGAPPPLPDDYRAGIVFVVDATKSLGPHIERTRTAIRTIHEGVKAAGLADKVSFGLIAYRDSLQDRPGLEWVTKTYATLEEGGDPEIFFERVKEVVPATVSSQGFVEDAYAGVKQAIEEMQWKGFNARYVVLITDAGPRVAGDDLSATGLSTIAMRRMAEDKGILLNVLHLLTPWGVVDHASARKQYLELTKKNGVGSLYYPVASGDVERFGEAVSGMTRLVVGNVREAAMGLPPKPVPVVTEAKGSLAEYEQKLAKMGYALRLRYLQKKEGVAIPNIFDAWMLDRDFENPERQAVEVRVLLSRNQLSDMREVLKQVLRAAEDGVDSPQNFLNDLKSLAAAMSRTPEKVASSTGAGGSNLADMGYLREYVEDLPYRGEVMNLSLEDWETWPAKRQFQFLNQLEAKINYYQALHDNTDLWVSLDGGAVTGDSVFPIALEMLP